MIKEPVLLFAELRRRPGRDQLVSVMGPTQGQRAPLRSSLALPEPVPRLIPGYLHNPREIRDVEIPLHHVDAFQ